MNKTPVPEKIANRPMLFAWLVPIYSAWHDLSTDRQSGMEEGRIPWTAARKYAEVYGYADDLMEFERFWRLIAEMDNAFLSFKSKKTKKLQDKNAKEAENKQTNRPKTLGKSVSKRPRTRRRR